MHLGPRPRPDLRIRDRIRVRVHVWTPDPTLTRTRMHGEFSAVAECVVHHAQLVNTHKLNDAGKHMINAINSRPLFGIFRRFLAVCQ